MANGTEDGRPIELQHNERRPKRDAPMLINRKDLIAKIDAQMGENLAAYEKAIADCAWTKAVRYESQNAALQWVITAIDEMVAS